MSGPPPGMGGAPPPPPPPRPELDEHMTEDADEEALKGVEAFEQAGLSADEHRKAQFGMPVGTTNTYALEGMEDMSPDEYMQAMLDKQMEERRQRRESAKTVPTLKRGGVGEVEWEEWGGTRRSSWDGWEKWARRSGVGGGRSRSGRWRTERISGRRRSMGQPPRCVPRRATGACDAARTTARASSRTRRNSK